MGKMKRKRSAPRQGPLPAKKANSETSGNSQTSLKAVKTVKQQLQMPNLEEKLCALQTIGTYLESEEYVKLLTDNGIVKDMLSLMTDENSQVRNNTVGTLRNFSTLSLDASEYLIEQDVMTPLIIFFKKYSEDWIPKQIQGHLDEDGDTFLQCVYLLWNLCESSEISVNYVHDSQILPILTRCLNRKVFGDELVTAIYHCILVIIEDNAKGSLVVKQLCETSLNELLSDKDDTPNGILLKTLAAGILLNIQHPNLSSISKDTLSNTLQIFNMTLVADIRTLCHKVSSVLPIQNDDTKPNAEIQKEIEGLKCLLDAQQTAIEIITNICSPEEDDTMDVDENSDADSDIDDENLECAGNGNDALYLTNKLPSEVLDLILNFSVIEKIWEKTSSLADNVSQILDETIEGKHILRRYHLVQSRALLCTNNFIENLSVESLGGHQAVYKVWVETGKLVFKTSSSIDDDEVLESATAVMRAALSRLKPNPLQINETVLVSNLFETLSTNDLQEIFTGITKCESLEVRANLIRMIGNLVLILNSKSLMNPSNIEISISEFLLDRIFKETDCWMLAEVLDTILDVFAEDETDKLAQQTNLVNKLAEIAPIMKNKVRLQKKTLGDHVAVVNTVASNLTRFIKYKRKRVELLR